MILRRLSAELGAQNWTTITIELAIVIVGVFIGTQVSNWNEAAAEGRAAKRMVAEVRPGLWEFDRTLKAAEDYFATAGDYGDTAFAGWANDPKVSDKQFVIAAYQASQITQVAMNGASWTQIYGGTELSKLSDPELRSALANVMALDFSQLGLASIATPYRQDVRGTIPEDIQDAIRAHCGDYLARDPGVLTLLPAKCDVDFPAEKWAAAARDLRAEPQLIKELRWHRAAVASFVFIAATSRRRVQRALSRIDAQTPATR